MFDYYEKLGPVYEIRKKESYRSISEAGIKNGLLFDEINFSIVNKVAVFPTWQQFEWE